jgi:hypothetical protein
MEKGIGQPLAWMEAIKERTMNTKKGEKMAYGLGIVWVGNWKCKS